MPAPIGLAATFDPSLARRFGGVIANEARAKRNDVLHAPTTNMMRTPLAGRTFEAFGEDPFLASRITVDWIEGAQAEGVIANVKHLAANNQEVNRFTTNAVIDERTLHEIYLPHFEAAVREAGVGTVMCSYNRLNGQKACENPHLLEDILKREWGFEGFVLSDYGFAMTSTAGAANGGTALELPQAFWYSPTNLGLAVLADQVSRATIDAHVRRVLRTMFAFGLFDRLPLVNDDRQIDQEAHATVAREVEEAAITLLKNAPAQNGAPLLPLDASGLRSIALIGADAEHFITGGGSGAVTPFRYVTPRQGIEQRAGAGIEVRFDPGQTPEAGAAAASGADVAIVFASDHQMEFVDKPCLTLECGNPDHGDQDGLIAAVAAANPRTIVVLETGGPVLMPWVDQVPAVVEAWYPGQEGGSAIAAALFGDVDPGGRLPATFPRDEGDKPANTPEQYPGVAENAQYSEGVFIGYRHYDEHGIEPLFPFGHGLSYTTFDYSRLRVRRPRRDGTVRVRVRVKNSGPRTGVEIVQLYLGLPEPTPDVPQPPKALKAIAKVSLAPGRRKRVRFELDRRAFSYWDTASGGWVVAPGCYDVMVGRSSRDLRAQGVVRVGGVLCVP
jgi:beta-glucosidase